LNENLRSDVGLVPVLFLGIKVSNGKVQQMLSEAELRAARFNRTMDLSGVSAGPLAMVS
jgi:hypothetical protein